MICILSLVYRKKKVPEHPTWKVVYSETMVKTMIIISDYTLVLKEDFVVFLLRAVRTPIFVPYVRERSATEIPDHVSAKRKAALRSQLVNLNTIRTLVGHEDERTTLKCYCFNRKNDLQIQESLEKTVLAAKNCNQK